MFYTSYVKLASSEMGLGIEAGSACSVVNGPDNESSQNGRGRYGA